MTVKISHYEFFISKRWSTDCLAHGARHGSHLVYCWSLNRSSHESSTEKDLQWSPPALNDHITNFYQGPHTRITSTSAYTWPTPSTGHMQADKFCYTDNLGAAPVVWRLAADGTCVAAESPQISPKVWKGPGIERNSLLWTGWDESKSSKGCGIQSIVSSTSAN